MAAPLPVLLALYLGAIVLLALQRRSGKGLDYLLAGRRLTLPALVATLVTTWYGGILGIGEYAWRYGVSTWVVFGLPYYLAALLFGFFLASRLRTTDALSIPELLERAYGRPAARTGAVAVLIQTVPAAYLLMLGTLISWTFGWSTPVAVLAGASFSALYVGLAGFRSVVRTDALQMVLMYGGFALLTWAALQHAGGLAAIWRALPASHRSFDGGLGWQAVAVWYLIALQTLAEPAFYQRMFAARSPRVARDGVFLSVLCWAVFDFLTISAGLAARVLVPGLEEPVAAYPALAELVLTPWPRAVFTLGLFATVMSTLDSYLFLAAATIGHDLLRPGHSDDERRFTLLGLAVATAAAVAGALAFSSVVQIWHHVGTVVTSSLLLPVLSLHLPPRWRVPGGFATLAMLSAAAVAAAWIVGAEGGRYPLGLEPMFPALAVSALCLGGGLLHARASRGSGAQLP